MSSSHSNTTGTHGEGRRRPNIVIFNPDQFRADGMGHLGNAAARTPTLDALVENEAVSFSGAFCQNPVCTPSRCSFMTGWYPHVRGHRTMTHMLHPERDEENLLRILKQNGYHVWWGGKNDLVPGQDGWEEHADVHFRATKDDYARWGYSEMPDLHVDQSWRGDSDGDNYYSFYAGRLDTKGQDRRFNHDWADIYGAVDFIRNYDGDEPFVLYLPLQSPHPPYGVEEPYFSAIDRGALPGRIPAPEDWDAAGKPCLLRDLQQRQRLGAWSEERFAELRATYYGMCSRIDEQLRVVIDALKERGFWDDAALFFFSDHGDFTGDYGLVEKTQNTFEEVLTRVPFIFKPPKSHKVHDHGLKPGVRDELVELIDFPATVFELTGIDPGYRHFGRSILPYLRGESDVHRDQVHCEGGRLMGESEASEKESLQKVADDPSRNLYYPRNSLQVSEEQPYHGKASMLRTRRYKYVRRLYESDELYELQSDPREEHNRIQDPALAEVRADLAERMLSWYQETADVVPFTPDRRRF